MTAVDDEVVRRARAAVAEAGYDPEGIIPPSNDDENFGYVPSMVPAEVAWRAAETAFAAEPVCFACTMAATRARRVEVVEECLAERRFVEDCGRDRSGNP